MNPQRSLQSAPLFGKGSTSRQTSISERLAHDAKEAKELDARLEMLAAHAAIARKILENESSEEPGHKQPSVMTDQEILEKFFPSSSKTKQEMQNKQHPPRILFQQSENPNEYILEIDNSSLEYFNACARAAEYQLIEGRGFDGNEATRYGSAIHRFLEVTYDPARSDVSPMETMIAMFKSFPPASPDNWRTLDHAITAMEQYKRRYDQEPDRLVVVHDSKNEPLVEVPFREPFTTIEVDSILPWPKSKLVAECEDDDSAEFYCSKVHVYWTGKIDLPCIYDQVPSILDHKTSSILSSLLYKEFELSSQTRGYIWAARRNERILSANPLFKNVSQFVLDLIVGRKPTRTGVAHEFERHKYNYTDDQIDEWFFDTTHIIADFLSHLVRGHFPMQTKWCVNKYGLCPYHDVCTLPKSMRHTLLSTMSRVTWSPLQ